MRLQTIFFTGMAALAVQPALAGQTTPPPPDPTQETAPAPAQTPPEDRSEPMPPTESTTEAGTDRPAPTPAETMAMEAWPADRKAEFAAWPESVRDYFWTLSEQRQALFWRLTDDDKFRLAAMDEAAQATAWESIEKSAVTSSSPAPEPAPGR